MLQSQRIVKKCPQTFFQLLTSPSFEGIEGELRNASL